MGGQDDSSAPTLVGWRPPAQLQKLHKSIASQTAIVPLTRVSSTLEDSLQHVKKNSLAVVQKAQATLGTLQAQNDADWQLLRRVDTRPPAAGMRRVHSDTDFQRRPVARLQLQRPPAVGGTPGAAGQQQQPQQLTQEQQRQADAWDWLSALNTTLNQARAAQQTRFQLSRVGLEEQAKQLVHSASSMSIAEVKEQLLQKPKAALSNAAATLETCQANLASLQTSLSQSLQSSLAEGRSTLERHLSTLGEPGSPSSSANRLAALLSPQRLGGLSGGGAAGDGGEGDAAAGGDAMSPWSLLPAPMRGREAAAIEALVTEDEQDQQRQQEEDEASTSGRGWGPFQRNARRRQRSKEGQRSSLREDGRQVLIVTTAALPWMTGTAVNPLLRAAYLARDKGRKVTLMIPWLAKADQTKIFPNNTTFDTPEQQEEYVRDWVTKRTGFESDFKVTFYPGRYAPEKCSILPVGDPTQYVPDHEADVAILEEPEHLNWYHHGRRWTDKFNHVVGVVHTNYLDYARREEGGDTKEFLLKHINNWVCRSHCHKVVKLSDAVQPLPKQTTEFVHGVAESFLDVGQKKSEAPAEGEKRFQRGAYFIGKVVWAKGYTELLDLMAKHSSSHSNVPMDCYGTGEDLEAVKVEAGQRNLALRFHGAKDHLDSSMHEYQVFINPSTSDVVATTTAEALAMGKWVICADHPSNRFFSQFKNCLIFKSPEEFSQHVEHALQHEPHPMGPEERRHLTWEAATERFLDVTELTEKDLKHSALDNLLWGAHNALTGMDSVRSVVGAGLNTRDAPQRITDYDPATSEGVGLFDDRRRLAKANGVSGGVSGGGANGSSAAGSVRQPAVAAGAVRAASAKQRA